MPLAAVKFAEAFHPDGIFKQNISLTLAEESSSRLQTDPDDASDNSNIQHFSEVVGLVIAFSGIENIGETEILGSSWRRRFSSRH